MRETSCKGEEKGVSKFKHQKIRSWDVRIIQNRPTMLHDSRNGRQIQDLAIIHNMAIRQIHLLPQRPRSAPLYEKRKNEKNKGVPAY